MKKSMPMIAELDVMSNRLPLETKRMMAINVPDEYIPLCLR